MKYKTIFVFVLLLGFEKSQAQDPAIIREYISAYKDLAIEEMQRTGVPAAIKLAQGIHETTAGTSPLVLRSNNHFGIKCKSNWKGQSVKHTDDAPNECFRKYDNPIDSYKDHSDFLKSNARYGSLFALDPSDYSGWAHGLKKAGYATNPKYPLILVKLIETYNLQDYTLIALGKISSKEEEVAAVSTRKKEEVVVMNEKSEAVAIVEEVGQEIEEEVIVIPGGKKISIEYPQGEFKLNETRVVFAKAGTLITGISNEYKVPANWLFDFNDMKPVEVIEKDQLIFLQRKRMAGAEDYYIVKEGETLYDIAQQQALRLEALLRYNNLKPDTPLTAGEKLYLKAEAVKAITWRR